jgi:hypothetical protein
VSQAGVDAALEVRSSPRITPRPCFASALHGTHHSRSPLAKNMLYSQQHSSICEESGEEKVNRHKPKLNCTQPIENKRGQRRQIATKIHFFLKRTAQVRCLHSAGPDPPEGCTAWTVSALSQCSSVMAVSRLIGRLSLPTFNSRLATPSAVSYRLSFPAGS